MKLAFISALVFEISQLQSAQDRVVLARNNAIIVRSEHYELVAMRDPGAKTCLACSAQLALARRGQGISPSEILPALYPQKRTCAVHKPMSADGETRCVVTAPSIRRRSAAWTILLD